MLNRVEQAHEDYRKGIESGIRQGVMHAEEETLMSYYLAKKLKCKMRFISRDGRHKVRFMGYAVLGNSIAAAMVEDENKDLNLQTVPISMLVGYKKASLEAKV